MRARYREGERRREKKRGEGERGEGVRASERERQRERVCVCVLCVTQRVGRRTGSLPHPPRARSHLPRASVIPDEIADRWTFR